MASGLYGPFKATQMGAPASGVVAADLNTDDIQVKLIDAADYTVNFETHVDLDDVAGAAEVATAALTGESLTTTAITGVLVFDANDVTFTSVTGDQSEALIVFNNTGAADANRLLIAYIDSFSAGMPVTPNGGNIVVQWAAGGIFTW